MLAFLALDIIVRYISLADRITADLFILIKVLFENFLPFNVAEILARVTADWFLEIIDRTFLCFSFRVYPAVPSPPSV